MTIATRLSTAVVSVGMLTSSAKTPVTTVSQQRAMQSGSLTLNLECPDTEHLTFTIRNSGAEDTALVLGTVLGNGTKYMVDNVTLVAQSADDQGTTWYRYRPYDYPAGIAGSLGEWIEPFPRRASYAMSAEAQDFLTDRGRLDGFPQRTELSLRLVVPGPRQHLMLSFWTGTLVSNHLRLPDGCGRLK